MRESIAVSACSRLIDFLKLPPTDDTWSNEPIDIKNETKTVAN